MTLATTDFRTQNYYKPLLRSVGRRVAAGASICDAIDTALRSRRFRCWAQIGAADCLAEDLGEK